MESSVLSAEGSGTAVTEMPPREVAERDDGSLLKRLSSLNRRVFGVIVGDN